MISRRTLAAGAAFATLSYLPWKASAAVDTFVALADKFAALERDSGGRLGVAALDTKTGRAVNWRGAEIFPMCSTFKVLAAAGALAQVDYGKTTLDARILYSERDLVTYSPVTNQHVGDGMTLAAVCEAAVTLSDNTPGNLYAARTRWPRRLHGLHARNGRCDDAA